MIYRTLGKSDLKLSAVTFGAWAAGGWMWGGNDPKEAIEAMRAAYNLGVTSIDTAAVYGMGRSEELVGKAIKDLPRDKVQVATKYGMRWDTTKGQFGFKSKNDKGEDIDIYKYSAKDSIIKECEDSLRRLGTDYIDLYQIHWNDSTTPIQESMETVAQLIKQGKVRYAGVCNYDAMQVAEAAKYVDLVSNQVPYSMVKRGVEAEVIPYCIQHNIGILAYSPLERGLLTGKLKPGHTFSDGDHRASYLYFKDENIRRTNAFLDNIRPLAKEKNATLAQLVIRWTLEQPGITITLVGARNAKQATENAGAANIELSKEEISFISSELEQVDILKTT